jgi:hypothetical protein
MDGHEDAVDNGTAAEHDAEEHVVEVLREGMRALRLAAENTALESTPSGTKARAVWGPGSKNLQSG